MTRARITAQDTTLDHQISLYFKQGDRSIIRVFCNCRLDHLGEMGTTGDPWVIYNNPNNHTGVFTPKETWKVFDV